MVSLNLEPQIAALQTWQNNINQAASGMEVTQTAMTQIQRSRPTSSPTAGNLEGANASQVDSVAASAQQALVQVADLLDTQDGNTYVFAGQDTEIRRCPIPNSILSSGFYTQIAAQVGQLGIQGAAATIANTLSIAGSNTAGHLAVLGLYVATGRQLAGADDPGRPGSDRVGRAAGERQFGGDLHRRSRPPVPTCAT